MQFCYWCGVACFGLFVTHSIIYRWERDNELKKAAWFMFYMFKFFSYSRPFWCSYSRMKYWKDNMYARARVCACAHELEQCLSNSHKKKSQSVLSSLQHMSRLKLELRFFLNPKYTFWDFPNTYIYYIVYIYIYIYKTKHFVYNMNYWER